MLNSIEPPWYGPVCPVVWEGRSREAPPYPDLGRYCIILTRKLALFWPRMQLYEEVLT